MSISELKCVYPPCGKELIGQQKRFCSDKHRERFRATNHSTTIVKVVKIPCTICGVDFKPRSKHSVYCGRLTCKYEGNLKKLDDYHTKLIDERRLNRENLIKKRQLTNFGGTKRYIKPMDQMHSDQYIPHVTLEDVTAPDLNQSTEKEAIQAFLDKGGKIKKVGYIQDTCTSVWEEQTEFVTSEIEDREIRESFRERLLE